MTSPGDGFELLGVRHVATSAFLRMEQLEMISPEGRRVERTVIRHPGAVAIVAVDGDDVVLIRQYRAPVDATILEIPAGKLDVADEDKETAAKRELEEEVGLRAADLELLASIWTAPGFADERIWIYLATDLTPVELRPHGVEEEAAEVVRLPLAEVPSLLASDGLEDAKTIVGLAALLARRS